MKKQIKTTARIFVKAMLLTLMSQPVCAQLDLPDIQREEEKKGFVCTLDEMMPSFPGGDRAFMEFLRNNIRCPEEVKKARLHGKVIVSFIIDKDGSVKNIRAVRSFLKDKRGERVRNWDLAVLCTEEAVRVFKLMPRWMPGISFGARYGVKYYFCLPFNDPNEELGDFIDSEEIWDEESLERYTSAFTNRYYWKTNPKRPVVTDEMKMTYRKPEGFCQVDSAESLRGYPKLRDRLGGMWAGPLLRCDDSQMISILKFAPIFTDEFIGQMSRGNEAYRPFIKKILEKHHYHSMRRMISSNSWRDSIRVISTEEARSKWNADSAFTFTLHLSPECYYEKNFKHLKVLLIQRKGRGYACIYSFYTDKAKENFDEYWRRIEKTLWFEE